LFTNLYKENHILDKIADISNNNSFAKQMFFAKGNVISVANSTVFPTKASMPSSADDLGWI